MLKIKLFCKHDYELVAIRKSNYTSDYHYFSDLGWYNDNLYICKKCKKEKNIVKQNELHPLYSEWEKV